MTIFSGSGGSNGIGDVPPRVNPASRHVVVVLMACHAVLSLYILKLLVEAIEDGALPPIGLSPYVVAIASLYVCGVVLEMTPRRGRWPSAAALVCFALSAGYYRAMPWPLLASYCGAVLSAAAWIAAHLQCRSSYRIERTREV